MRGVTLVELVVALAVIGVGLGVAGLAVRALEAGPEAQVLRTIDSVRARAIATGEPVVAEIGGRAVRFAPDGSALGGPLVKGSFIVRVDPLTGEVRLETR
jgi:prepilin-type N-terminal cleavage/methylation domain-containing protein